MHVQGLFKGVFQQEPLASKDKEDPDGCTSALRIATELNTLAVRLRAWQGRQGVRCRAGHLCV